MESSKVNLPSTIYVDKFSNFLDTSRPIGWPFVYWGQFSKVDIWQGPSTYGVRWLWVIFGLPTLIRCHQMEPDLPTYPNIWRQIFFVSNPRPRLELNWQILERNSKFSVVSNINLKIVWCKNLKRKIFLLLILWK